MHTRLHISLKVSLPILLIAFVGLLFAGCSEPFTAYHATTDQGYEEYVADGGTILVMPFMDSRTFVDKNDPHKMDLGAHARTIFVAAMRDANAGAGATIITPRMPQPTKSLTNAEVAEIGRAHGADIVVAGQVFSFTGTRAASIPPRAGMFVRVISARDGALLFVGDHYQSASIPGAPGGRELQARQVSERLIEGLLSKALPAAVLARGIAGGITSSTAMAMIPAMPLFSGFAVGVTASGETAFAAEGGSEPVPLPPPAPEPESEPEQNILSFVDTAAAAIIDELPEIDLAAVDPNMVPVGAPPPVSVAAKLSGDALAEDLFADNGEVYAGRSDADGTEREARAGRERMSSETLAEAKYNAPAGVGDAAGDNSPLVSMPLAVEQPHTFKSVDSVNQEMQNREVEELAEDPDAARESDTAAVNVPGKGGADGIRVLILPYHDLPNGNNLIPNTGGGEVVTTLFGTQLAMDSGITLLWDGGGQATHDRLVSREEAILMGRQAGADYVIRGQVVEFRRAQSVPSFYSAMISTAVLAAQLFFAEMSGVDVATEVYRVSDGLCVMSRRDRSQQKYVVQAEKTVRRMAATALESISLVVREENPEEMDPLIDELSPEILLTDAE